VMAEKKDEGGEALAIQIITHSAAIDF